MDRRRGSRDRRVDHPPATNTLNAPGAHAAPGAFVVPLRLARAAYALVYLLLATFAVPGRYRSEDDRRQNHPADKCDLVGKADGMQRRAAESYEQ